MLQEKTALQNTYKSLLFLKGHKDTIAKEKDEIYTNVEKAKKWLVKKPDYLKFLQHLQHILHEKNIGIFSELLTYFVKDVLNKDKEIKLDLYTYHHLPALKIEASNNGNRESIYEGNGGSIANIVSTGLRLISLSRMNHRKFIILDEPDCWVAPQHIPLFAKIIGEISRKLKIQTVLISHHKWEYFKDYGRVIELKQDGAHLSAEMLHDTEVDEYPADYLEEITLRRVMSHYDTTYKLHPYLTCIIGENDIGKSVIAPAMKAIAYGDSSDSYIKHNEKDAQVVVKSSLGYQMMWQRFLETTQENPQKVKYTLYEKDKEPKSEFNSSDCPDFINEKLQIALTEDIDVHIGNQKQPIFMLSSDVKPQDRAKILSLGRESLIVQKMMETIKTKTKTNKSIVTDGELKYEKITRQLKHLDNVESLIEKVEELTEFLFTIEQSQKASDDLFSLVNQYENLSLIEKLEPVAYNLFTPDLKETDYIDDIIENMNFNSALAKISSSSLIQNKPSLHYMDEIESIIEQLKISQQLTQVNLIKNFINIPSLRETENIFSLINDISYKQKILNTSLISPVTIPVFNDQQDIEALISSYEQSNDTIKEWEIKGGRLDAWKIAIDDEMKQFLEISGGKCPACGQQMSIENIKGHLND